MLVYKFEPKVKEDATSINEKTEEELASAEAEIEPHTSSVEESPNTNDHKQCEDSANSSSSDSSNALEGGSCDCGSFRLDWKHSFSDPLFAVDSLDLIGDGLEELVVLSQSGVHVLQHDPDAAMELCIARLKMAAQQQQVPSTSVYDVLKDESIPKEDELTGQDQ